MHCVSGYLIFGWKNYADRVAIVGFLFWLSCNILNKHVNGRIYELIFVSKKLEQDLKPKEIKPSFVSNALFANLHVICVMQIMLATQPDTFIKALPNTSIQLPVNIY